jgi:hypothetical protein
LKEASQYRMARIHCLLLSRFAFEWLEPSNIANHMEEQFEESYKIMKVKIIN